MEEGMNEAAETQMNSDMWEARLGSSRAEQSAGCMPLEKKEEESLR